MFECRRCGYASEHKHCLIKHLQRANECFPVLADLSRIELIKEFDKKFNETTFDCDYCAKKFNTRSSKYRHQSICKKKETQTLEYQVKELQEQIKELQGRSNGEVTKPIKTVDTNSTLQLELQYYKNRKSEAFYQLMLESYMKGTHKTLTCGVTDVTTEDCHAEIKEWKCWKEAIGQLTVYNTIDPKPKLHMYMFGRYTQSHKERARDVAEKCGFDVFEFKDGDDGSVYIENMSTQENMYCYKPAL